MTENEDNNESNIIPISSANLAKLNSGLASRGLDLVNSIAQKKKARELVKSELQKFEYETVKVNRQGEIIQREVKQANYFNQDLGDDVILEMVEIPLGKFIMGTPEAEIKKLNQKYKTNWYNTEKPQHQVIVPSFFMAKYPITQAQWQAIACREDLKVDRDLKSDISRFKGNDLPVETVSWLDAVEFCSRLSKLTQKKYRLPTEAQWEYACRGISSYQSSIEGEQMTLKQWNEDYYQPFHFGETITTDLANYYGKSTYAQETAGICRQQSTPVGQFPANPFGLYDLHGNVWEWCLDRWHYNYKNITSEEDSLLDRSKEKHVLRGGSWGSSPHYCRCSNRIYEMIDKIFSHNIGFRVVLTIDTDK